LVDAAKLVMRAGEGENVKNLLLDLFGAGVACLSDSDCNGMVGDAISSVSQWWNSPPTPVDNFAEGDWAYDHAMNRSRD
jgi:hypothetical protein